MTDAEPQVRTFNRGAPDFRNPPFFNTAQEAVDWWMDVDVPQAAVDAMAQRRIDCINQQAYNYCHEVKGVNFKDLDSEYAVANPDLAHVGYLSDAEQCGDPATIAARQAHDFEAYMDAQRSWRERQVEAGVAFIEDTSRGPDEPSTATPPKPWFEDVVAKKGGLFSDTQYVKQPHYNMPRKPFIWHHMRAGTVEDCEAICRVIYADMADMPDSERPALWNTPYRLPSGENTTGAEIWNNYGGAVVLNPAYDVLQGRPSVMDKYYAEMEEKRQQWKNAAQAVADEIAADRAYKAAYQGQVDAMADYGSGGGGGHPILGGMAAAALGYTLGRRR